jgi:phosphocarrier protein
MSLSRRQVQITDPLGLHFRAASTFVVVARKYEARVQVRRDDTIVNGKSLLDVVMLAGENGTTLDLEARGPDADAALDALCELFEPGYFE